MHEDKSETIEELREELAKQTLKLAIDSDNPQYKVDVLRATATSAKLGKPVASEPAAGGMSMFQARIRQAERGNGTEPAQTDC